MRQRQLELFTRSELASMRDRTRALNYSPEGEQFRRDHERHRRWGLDQRYGFKMMELRRAGEPFAVAAARAGGWQALTAAQVMEVAAASLSWDRTAGGARSSDRMSVPGGGPAGVDAGPVEYVASAGETQRARQFEPPAPVIPPKQNEPAQPAERNEQAQPAERNEQAQPAERNEQAQPAEQNEQGQPAEQNEQAGPAERSQQAESADQAGSVGRVGSADRNERAERSESAGSAERAGSVRQAESAVRTEPEERAGCD